MCACVCVWASKCESIQMCYFVSICFSSVCKQDINQNLRLREVMGFYITSPNSSSAPTQHKIQSFYVVLSTISHKVSSDSPHSLLLSNKVNYSCSYCTLGLAQTGQCMRILNAVEAELRPISRLNICPKTLEA